MIRWLRPTDSRPDLQALGCIGPAWDQPHLLTWGQTSFSQRMPTAVLDPVGPVQPLPPGPSLAFDRLRFHDPLLDRSIDAQTFLDRRLFNDGLLVMHRGRVVHERYRNGLTSSDLHVVHSVSKTLTTMMVGIAVGEGRLDPMAPVAHCVPALAALPAWSTVKLQHVLDMASGIDCDEDYRVPDSMYWRYARSVGYAGGGEQAEGALAFLLANLTRSSEPPGTRFNYASYLTNLLPLALEHSYGQPALELYASRLFGRIGAEQRCEINVDSQRLPIVEGQVNLTLRDLARWASLYLHEGRSLAGEALVPPAWIEATLAATPARLAAFTASDASQRFPRGHYANQCWVVDAQRRRLAMLGIHGQFAYLDLPAQLMIVGLGSFPVQVAPLMTASLQQLWAVVSAEVGAG